jgi:hypothetical protein
MNRLLSLLLAALLGGAAGVPAALAGEPAGGKKKLLLITESRGFRHGVVTRKASVGADVDPKALGDVKGLEVQRDKNGKVNVLYTGRIDTPAGTEIKAGGKVIGKAEPALVEVIFMELAKKTGQFDVVCSQDSRAELTGENLKKFDAVWFYTTGELPLSEGQKSDLLGFVRSGKGFGGSHSATDTFYKWKEYGQLIGAYFKTHPPGLQDIVVKVEDTRHPATHHLKPSFPYKDEIYHFKDPGGSDKLPPSHVLMRIDPELTKKNQWREDKNNPLAWTREYGKGRVFYTALGHADHVWRDPLYQQHVVGGLRYLFRQEGADGAGEKK